MIMMILRHPGADYKSDRLEMNTSHLSSILLLLIMNLHAYRFIAICIALELKKVHVQASRVIPQNDGFFKTAFLVLKIRFKTN
jgi:hypothetical protein